MLKYTIAGLMEGLYISHVTLLARWPGVLEYVPGYL